MLTKRGKYGLKALIHLARLKPGERALGSEIADANNIPKKFLDAILAELRRGGLVHTRKGPGGGYTLARDAGRITLGEIIRILDGPLSPLRCASRSAYEPCDDCTSPARCAVRLAMLEVRDAMAGVLDHTTLDDMLADRRRARQVRASASGGGIEGSRRRSRRALA